MFCTAPELISYPSTSTCSGPLKHKSTAVVKLGQQHAFRRRSGTAECHERHPHARAVTVFISAFANQ